MINMLCYRSWLETRWRFMVGLALALISTVGSVWFYPQAMELLPLASNMEFEGPVATRIAESVELSSTFAGYVWTQAFNQNLLQYAVLFAALLGVAGPLLPGQGRSLLFMLALPVTRSQLLLVRAATGLTELFVLLLVPALAISLTAPAVGEHYSLATAMIHGLSLFGGASVFFGAALLLSTVFDDVWRPLLIVCGIAVVLGILSRPLAGLSIFPIMSAETYFRGNSPNWLGLLVCVLITAALLVAAMQRFSRRDF